MTHAEPASPAPSSGDESRRERPLAARLHPARHLRYMEQDCPCTVRDALELYYAQIDDLITEENAPAEVAALFRYHDLVHVVFGCDTSIRGETMADVWALAGTDVTFRYYMRYLELQETQAIFAALGTGAAIRQMLASLHLIPLVLYRALGMKRKWPFRDHARYLDRPLGEVREELGIRVIA